MDFISKILNKYMALFILAAGVVSFFNPSLTSWLTKYSPVMLGIIMFGMGFTLKKEDLKIVLEKPSYVIIGAALQFTIMPFLAYILTIIFNLPKELAISVILVGSVSGGTASNVITYLSKGNVPLSISMTTFSTIAGVFITPILIYFLAGKWIKVSIAAMSFTIMQIIILPIILGILIKYFFYKTTDKYVKIMPAVSIVTIMLMCSAIIGRNSDILFKYGVLIIAVVMIHNVLGLVFGYIICLILRIPEKERRAIAIEVGMQNSGLATNIANIHFTPASAIAGAVFTIWHNISGAILASYWSRKKIDGE